MARSRPSKRARKELADGPSTAAPDRQAATLPRAISFSRAISLEQLPGDLLSRILQLLSLKEAFRVRGVSREQWGVALDSLERLVRGGRLKGSGLSVSVECSEKLELSSLGAQPVALLAALAGRCRSVRVKFNFLNPPELVLRWHVVDVLDALAPGGAAGPLQELELLSTGDIGSSLPELESPSILDLPEECLAPFAGLQTLRLAPDLPLSAGTAAAIAARLPALRCLQLRYDQFLSGVLAELGPLRLERLVLCPGPDSRRAGSRMNICRNLRLEEIAGTPLGRSLRELHFEDLAEPLRRRSMFPFRQVIPGGDLRALAGMPQLESVTGFPCLYVAPYDDHELGLLLRAPRLASLQLDAPDLTWKALTNALAAGPLPPRLALDLRSASAEVLTAASPVLRTLELGLPDRGPTAEVRAALLRCTRLESLLLRAQVVSESELSDLAAGLAPLAALPPLPGGLRLEVRMWALRHEELAARANGPISAALLAGLASPTQAMESLSAALPAAAIQIRFEG
eukprot:tig00001007_g6239.t1